MRGHAPDGRSWRLRLAFLLAANLAATTNAQPPDEPPSYLRTTYVGAVTTPRMRSAMDVFMTKPIDAIRYSQPAFTLGMLHSTEEMRRWLYTQVLAVSSMLDNSFTMFYAGAEDGRFVGYYDPLRYTFRPRGEALADAPTSAEDCVSPDRTHAHHSAACDAVNLDGDAATCTDAPPRPVCDLSDATDGSAACPVGCVHAAERCAVDPCEGYVAGTAGAPSNSCPAGCTLTPAAGVDPEACTPVVTDCSTGYVAGSAANPSSSCPTGCVLHQESCSDGGGGGGGAPCMHSAEGLVWERFTPYTLAMGSAPAPDESCAATTGVQTDIDACAAISLTGADYSGDVGTDRRVQCEGTADPCQYTAPSWLPSSSASKILSATCAGERKGGVNDRSCTVSCTGADDGSGSTPATACALNAEKTGCAVEGGDCEYVECCDRDIRSYHNTGGPSGGGAPESFYKWVAYDPRERPWYKEEMERKDLPEDHPRAGPTGWSSIYPFSTTG
jgi:hypothetical protein